MVIDALLDVLGASMTVTVGVWMTFIWGRGLVSTGWVLYCVVGRRAGLVIPGCSRAGLVIAGCRRVGMGLIGCILLTVPPLATPGWTADRNRLAALAWFMLISAAAVFTLGELGVMLLTVITALGIPVFTVVMLFTENAPAAVELAFAW